MARGVTLLKLLDELRAEAKGSLNTAHNEQVRDKQVLALQAAQNMLWEDFAWPFLRAQRRMALSAGQYLYDPPEDLDLDRLETVELKDGGRWRPLCEGIESCHYSEFDSVLGDRSWPVERWRLAEEGQIEVWPVPDTSGTATDHEGYLQFTGLRKLKKLVDDADTCDLDSRLIVLNAALGFLTGDSRNKAINEYKTLLGTLRGRGAPRGKTKMFGVGVHVGRVLHGPPTIHYRDRETGS